MSSILTNTSAMVALQTLKVATAKENSSSWSIASTMNSDVRSSTKLSDSLTSASALVGTARVASEQVADILKQIQEKVVQAENPDADTAKLSDSLTIGSRADASTFAPAADQFDFVSDRISASRLWDIEQALDVSISFFCGGDDDVFIRRPVEEGPAVPIDPGDSGSGDPAGTGLLPPNDIA